MKRHSLLAAMTAALAFTRADAQVIRGSVRDQASKQPIARATVILLGEKDSVLREMVVGDSGRYVFTVAPGAYSLNLRRVGWTAVTTQPFRIRPGDTLSADFYLEKAPQMLDTVVSVETSGVFNMTTGKEFVRKHFIAGVGLQISGFEIERTGLTLSQYLGKQAGVALTPVYPPDLPLAPGRDGQALMSTAASQCLYVRLDRTSLLFKLMNDNAEHIDEVIRVQDIMAVEYYASNREVPKEWQQDAFVEELYTRRNAGKKYTIGNVGFPKISQDLIDNESPRYETRGISFDPRVARQSGDPTHIPPCGFLQIWTRLAWGG